MDRSITHVVGLLLLSAAVFLPVLGQEASFGSREARHAEIAREMAERGEWIVPYLLGEPYTLKMPLYNLTVSWLYQWTGRANILLARLPSAVAGAGLALVAYALGRRWFGARAGLWAAAMQLTFGLVIDWGRTARPDMMMAAWVALGVLLADVAAMAQGAKGAWLAWVGACLSASAGVLSKGPHAALFFVCIAALVWRARCGRWLPPVPKALVAIPLIVALPVAWAIVTEIRSPGYLHALFSYQYGKGLREHPKHWTLYLVELPLFTLPWSLFALGAGWAAVQRLRQNGLDLYCVPPVLVVLCVAVMTPISNRMAHYTLPFIPMWALTLAAFLDRAARTSPRDAAAEEAALPGVARFLFIWPLRLCLGCFLAGAIGAPIYWALKVGRGTPVIVAVGVCLAAAALLGLAAAWRKRPARAVGLLLGIVLVAACAAHPVYYRYVFLGPEPELAVVDAVIAAMPAELPVGSYRITSELLFLRLNRPVCFLKDEADLTRFLHLEGRRCLLTRAAMAPLAQQSCGSPLRLIGSWRLRAEDSDSAKRAELTMLVTDVR